MKKILTTLLTAFLVTSIIGCSSVTMRPFGGKKETRQPEYSERKDYYLLGSIGEHEINTTEICGERQVKQMQAVTTLSDWLHSVFTIFIYTPRTAKVWCEEIEEDASNA